MKRDDFSRALWGGYVTRQELDLPGKSYAMDVAVTEGQERRTHQVEFVSISKFHFEDEHVNTWERVELTEVRILEAPEASPSEEWAVWMNLWDVAQLTITCAVIRVDGMPLK